MLNKSGILKHYTTKDGLASNEVFSIAVDPENSIWFGTRSGVSKLKRSN